MADNRDHTEKATILLLEDNVVLALDLEETFSAMGYHVLGPFSAVADARAAAAAITPDVACLDLNASDELAFGLARELAGRGVHTTLLTGQGVLARLSGITGVSVLDKPVSEAGLREHFAPFAARRQRRSAE